MTKKEARKYYRKLREQLSDEQYRNFNQRILKTFSSFDFNKVGVLHCYISMKEKREPDTENIIRWLRGHHPNITTCIPRSAAGGGQMDNVIYDDRTILEENEFGIPEPVDGEHLDAREIDMAVIPMLGFDSQGNRVGYGKGCRPETLKVGLCFFDPVLLIEDTHQFDVPLNRCITPFNLYVF
jgi:5-formyltetrahydrofolate cyclo-ligase